MSEGPPLKKLRKGTRSCIECRQRKVRCVWPSEDAETCQNCLARNRKCETQVQMMATSDMIKTTSRARIERLEGDVSGLRRAVRDLEAKLGCTPSEAARRQSPPWAKIGPQSMQNEEDSDSDLSVVALRNPPSHILRLFDNGLLGASNERPRTPSGQAQSSHSVQDVAALRRLMPTREDMLLITAHASSWLYLYRSLFPASKIGKTPEDMLSLYDRVQHDESSLVAVAVLLMSIALTAQQVPATESIKNASLFIREVSDTVERVVISNDALVESLEGIEASLHFLRLQLGRARIKKLWLGLRRVIALAELMGLPRASMAITEHQEPSAGEGQSQPGVPSSLDNSRREKSELWESICALDRIAATLWSLPLATTSHSLPQKPLVSYDGFIIPQSFLYRLANMSSRIVQLESMYISSRLSDLFNSVMAIDQELRSLNGLTPKGWWKVEWTELSVDALLQYWYQYLLVRTHLQLALMHDESQQFAFNFLTCLDACQAMVRRFMVLRPLLPAGFFVNQVVDVQIFTAVVFLLLAGHRAVRGSGTSAPAADSESVKELVDQVTRTMDSIGAQPGGDFAREAAGAARSLRSLLRQTPTSESRNITMNLPLVGRIHVSSRATKPAPEQFAPATNQQPQGAMNPMPGDNSGLSNQAMPMGFPNLSPMDYLTYSLEIPEGYPFLIPDGFEFDQWFTQTELTGNA